MELITTFAVIVLLAVILRLYVFKSRTEQLLAKIPGPTSYPIIGNLLEFNYPRKEITETTKELSFKYGPVYLIRLGMDPGVFIRHPQDIELVLGNTSVIDKAFLYWPLLPWLNQGLLTSGGDRWRKHRKILTPAFHFRILESFVPVFVKNSHILIRKLDCLVDQDINVMPVLALCALDIICETAMGLEVNAQNKESKYVQAVDELLEIIAHRNFSLMQRSFLFSLLPVGRRHNQLVAYLHSVTENVIKERKAKLERSLAKRHDSSLEDELGMKKKKVFLDLLLEYNLEGAGMTDTDIREEVDTFMFEGYDTTTSALAFVLYCISQNPQVQEKVYEELHQIFGDSKRDCTFQDLQDMKYLDKVIKESLRLYPVIQFVARKSKTDLKLKSGYVVPANVCIGILIEPMNLDPEIHPEPLKFNPDRFDNRNLHPYAFIPFSAGPRNCIGQKYAVLEVKTLASLIVRNFYLLPSKTPIVNSFKIVLKSKTGVHLTLQHRMKR